MSTSAEQRNYDRIPVKNRVKVLGKGRLAMFAIAINLSMGGVLLNATPSLPVGSSCDVTLFDHGVHTVLTKGIVVRSDAGGTAIKFAQLLAPDNVQVLAAQGGPIRNAVVDAYLTYFQVGRNEDNAGCETLLGVSRRTFRTVFYTTFSASLPAAILPVWFLRASIQSFATWEKLAACFIYGAFWYLLLQPTLDLAVLYVLRKRKLAGAPAMKS